MGVKRQSITNPIYVSATTDMLVGAVHGGSQRLTIVFPVVQSFPQQSERLINQLREITGVQDPQILYRALNVRP